MLHLVSHVDPCIQFDVLCPVYKDVRGEKRPVSRTAGLLSSITDRGAAAPEVQGLIWVPGEWQGGCKEEGRIPPVWRLSLQVLDTQEQVVPELGGKSNIYDIIMKVWLKNISIMKFVLAKWDFS